MDTHCALITVLLQVTDFRKQRGKRHPLSALLANAFNVALLKNRTQVQNQEHAPRADTELDCMATCLGPRQTSYLRVWKI